MQVDAYQLCPCGSGKKIKFCKCGDNFQELDKLDRMIEGGQLIAALDRINSLIKTSPNAAWLLSLKAQIQLQLQEFEGFFETANRFFKLRPDNPLALLLLSFAGVMKEENVQVPIKHYLEALAESREQVHPFVANAVSALVRRLVMQNLSQTAMRILLLTVEVAPYREVAGIIDELREDSEIGLFSRLPSQVIPRPEQGPWLERFDEATSLLRGRRVFQAYNKLLSLNREFPDQPAVQSQLMNCEIIRGDSTAAAQLALRISRNETVSTYDRIYYLVTSIELDPSVTNSTVPATSREVEVSNEELEAIEQKLKHYAYADLRHDDQVLHALSQRTGDGVRPRAVSYIFVPQPQGAVGADDPQFAELFGSAILYGRQTDRSAYVRFELELISPSDEAAFVALIEHLGISKDRVKQSEDVQQLAFDEVYRRSVKANNDEPSQGLTEHEVKVADVQRQIWKQRFLQTPVPLLDGKTPLEVAELAEYQLRVRAWLLFVRSRQYTLVESGPFNEVASILKLPQSESIALDRTGFEDSFRWTKMFEVDLGTGNLDLLLRFATFIRNFKVSTLFLDAADAIKARLATIKETEPGIDESLISAGKMLENAFRLAIPAKLENRIALLEELIRISAADDKPVGYFVMQAVRLYVQDGRQEEASKFMDRSLRQFPKDPVLLSFLQEMAAQQQTPRVGDIRNALLQRQLSQLRGGPALEEETDSGIWTPDKPAASPAAAGEGSGSKLWLPGMD